MFMSSVVYIGCNFFFDFYMLGSYVDLFIIAILGAVSLISLGLLVASRSKSEELIGGLLNLISLTTFNFFMNVIKSYYWLKRETKGIRH